MGSPIQGDDCKCYTSKVRQSYCCTETDALDRCCWRRELVLKFGVVLELRVVLFVVLGGEWC